MTNSKNTAKSANTLFLAVVSIALLANIAVSFLRIKEITINIVANLLISQMIIVIPGLFYLLMNNSRDNRIHLSFRKLRFTTFFLLLVFTWLLMPLVTAANAFSQLFTKNEVVSISGQVLDVPFLPMVLIIGIIGPFCEELVFRGLIYRGLRGYSNRPLASAVVSALFFGLMHMNLNQFCYAFVLGISFAIIDEALDSIWPSFICHAVVNSQNVILMYVMDKVAKMYGGEGLPQLYSDTAGADGIKIVMAVMFVMFTMIAVVTTLLACLLFYGICVLEGRSDELKSMFKKSKSMNGLAVNNENTESDSQMVGSDMSDELSDNGALQKTAVVYMTGYIAITVCIFVMFLLEPLINVLK